MDYFELLDQVHRAYRPRGYVEIGVSQGESLRLVLDGTHAIGVDPAPRVKYPLSSGTVVEPCTSDDFFARRAATAMGDHPLDVGFIDGMHLFEFALRDFVNLERLANDDTVIFIHDCLPNSAIEAERNRASRLWTGDVWKLLVFLTERRPHLEIVVTEAPPTGLVAVGGFSGERGADLDDDEVESAIEAYMNLGFEDFERFRDDNLTIVAGTLDSLRPLFPGAPWQDVNDVAGLVAARDARVVDIPLSRRIVESRAVHDARIAPAVFLNWLKYRL